MSEFMDRSRDIGQFTQREDDNVIICRCEEITKGEIRRAVHDGMWTMTEVKRYLRTGMGLCQGQTCERIVKNIIAIELGKNAIDIDDAVARGPSRPIELEIFRNEVEN